MSTDPAKSLLRLSGIWKRYPGVAALKDVSFSAEAGKVHALLGENGAGKTTLMGVASGSVIPDEGIIEVGGTVVPRISPLIALGLGVAIVHQRPALIPDLTVLENMVLGVPPRFRGTKGESDRAWARRELDRLGCDVDLNVRIEEVGVPYRQLIELAKAFAAEPDVLILDEPTAPLGAARVERLFELIREAAARGAAIVYISHRLPEVRAIADTVTVLRDGAVRGTFDVADVTDQELLALIVGRALETVFPPKAGAVPESASLEVRAASGRGFESVDLVVHAGEIVGLAGIAGNGQTEFLRSLAGLVRATGEVTLGGKSVHFSSPGAARAAGISYVSADRHSEGLFERMSVRENVAVSALERFRRWAFLDRESEVRAVEDLKSRLSIRTPSVETSVSSLSGGNQQKVVLARSVLAQPALLLVDEPTQGVDAGARVEIYAILRSIASSGVPVVILSSDGLELEGLCDRVYVFSRGSVVAELAAEAVTEHEIAHRMVTATVHRRADQETPTNTVSQLRRRVARFAKSDWFPAVVLLAVMAVLLAYTYHASPRVLSPFNIKSALALFATLAMIGMGQTAVIMTGGIDISTGPLAGFLVIVASFFMTEGSSVPTMLLGLALMLAVGLGVGLVNGSLVRFGKFTPVAATLTMYILLQGLALILRPVPGGRIVRPVVDLIDTSIGPIPVVFVVAVVAAIVAEYVLRRSGPGRALRAVGSADVAAHRLGVPVSRTYVLAYVTCGFLVFLGSVMFVAQISIGDPAAGTGYTLSSVTAVVLGGTSLFGGRGSFIGTLLGAALIQQLLNATVFLGLNQAWQFWFLGLMTLVAAGLYSQARRVKDVN